MSDMSGILDELLRDVMHKFPPSLWGELKAVVKAAYDAGYEYRTPVSELSSIEVPKPVAWDPHRGDGGDAA